MLNSIGLANPGLEHVLVEKAPIWRDLPCPVIVSIQAQDPEGWTRLAHAFQGLANVQALEANLSCPNVPGGMNAGSDPARTGATIEVIRQASQIPVIAKLSPNVTDMAEIAYAAQEAGAHACTVMNTLVGMVVDVTSGRPVLGAGTGGLSGPAIRPLAVARVYEVARAVSIPVIGVGGVGATRDALEFLMVGARAVQVGSRTFRNPWAAERIVEGLRGYTKGCESTWDQE